jgi:hypothetical protein
LPGRNSAKLADAAESEFNAAGISNLFDGHQPSHTIIMNGVNDVAQHIGAARYAAETARLVHRLGGAARVQVISVPRFDVETPATSLSSRIKRYIYRYLNDQGRLDVIEDYRLRLTKDHPDIQIIDYDNFIPDFRGHETAYEPDGAHLTSGYLRLYGTFLSGNLSIAKAE